MRFFLVVFGTFLFSHAMADFRETSDRLGFRASDAASRTMPGWELPKRVVIMVPPAQPDNGPGSKAWFKEVAGDAELVFVPFSERSNVALEGADVYLGWCRPGLASIDELDYVHIFSAGLDGCTRDPALVNSELIGSNSAKAASETIAEHAIAMTLALGRNLHGYRDLQAKANWDRNWFSGSANSVNGKTMLVLGLGGIGSQTAKRAHALGMRVVATRNSRREGPEYVSYVGLSDEALKLAAEADVVVNALPATDKTRGSINAEFFEAMKPSAFYVSVGRGTTTDTDALVRALNTGEISAAALDVTDPEPLPSDHALWALPNVIITPHMAGMSDLSRATTQALARENLRRYVAGEPLLNKVDFKRGY
ncbi:MAG: D-2-hydroxyacid dehydrogenase [Pseudomonadota bacterium]